VGQGFQSRDPHLHRARSEVVFEAASFLNQLRACAVVGRTGRKNAKKAKMADPTRNRVGAAFISLAIRAAMGGNVQGGIALTAPLFCSGIAERINPVKLTTACRSIEAQVSKALK